MNFRKIHQKLFLLLVLLLPVQLGRHFWPNWSYVIGLRIDYLSPTIYLTDILVFLILFFWLLEKSKNIKSEILNFKFRNLFLLFSIFIFLLVNSLLAQNSGAALYKFVKILEFSLLGFYVFKNNYTLKAIRYPLSLAVVYSSFIAIAQFIKQTSLGGPFWFLGERTFNAATPGIAKAVVNGQLLLRPYATFPHPNVLAGFLLISLILTIPFLLKKSKLLAICYLLLVICTIGLTFSRAVWLVGLITGIFLIVQLRRLRVAGYGLIVFAGEAYTQRAELNKIALQLIRQYPLSGVGLNNFIVQLPHFWQNPNPIYLLQPVHNIYLLIAAETGLVGLLIFLWFIYLTFKKLSIIHSPFSIALSAILALGFFDHYWFTLQQPQLLFAIVLGLSWGSAKISS